MHPHSNRFFNAALLCDRVIDIKDALGKATPKSDFPKFLDGYVHDSEFGGFYGVDLSEIETNFNAYLESNEEDTNTNQEQDYDEERV